MPFQYEVSYTLGQSDSRNLIYRGVRSEVQFRLPAGPVEKHNHGKAFFVIMFLH